MKLLVILPAKRIEPQITLEMRTDKVLSLLQSILSILFWFSSVLLAVKIDYVALHALTNSRTVRRLVHRFGHHFRVDAFRSGWTV